jgi:EAL domain-containing protein (putative c-di-GMP-specific phosphodiesterase class I)
MAIDRSEAGKAAAGAPASGPFMVAELGLSRFQPAHREEAAEQRRLEQDLGLALARGGLMVHYQPRVSMRSGRTVGAEALLRWRHPRRGMVPPSAFIPVAERCGLITELGGWVLERACAEAALWPDRIGLSVNVSARQLVDAALLPQVSAALAGSGLAPRRLEVELTESMLVGASIENLLTLSAVRDMGVGIALDDFGTGYASLASLRHLPLTALKLDRSMIKGMLDEPENLVIIRAMVEIGHALGLKVVAEGVETPEERDALAELGCNEGQAYLFGRPMPGEALRKQLADEA